MTEIERKLNAHKARIKEEQTSAEYWKKQHSILFDLVQAQLSTCREQTNEVLLEVAKNSIASSSNSERIDAAGKEFVAQRKRIEELEKIVKNLTKE